MPGDGGASRRRPGTQITSICGNPDAVTIFGYHAPMQPKWNLLLNICFNPVIKKL